MKIDIPAPDQIASLLRLWNDVFGEYDGFWERFLESGFSPRRCRCVTENGQLTASLCWLDAALGQRKLAYLYAIVTHPDHRGRGLCRALLADTHAHLAALGYDGALLVPADETLRRMYEGLGYETATTVSEFSRAAGEAPIALRAVGTEEYAALRRAFLPDGGVVQEEENLRFLARQARFWAGTDFLLAADIAGKELTALELLGNPQAAPGILAALNCDHGRFRLPGKEKPFAMFHPLTPGAQPPGYFGFAFD